MPRLAPLRSKLLLLAAGSVLPVLVLTSVLSWLVLDHQRENSRRVAQERNRMFITALEAQMEGHLAALRALAASSALQARDLRGFDAEARRVLPTQDGWQNIMVLDPAGRQLVNVKFPYPKATTVRAAPNEMEFVRRALAGGAPVIGNVSTGPVTGRPGVAVRLGVQPAKGGPLVLQFVLAPDSLAPLMKLVGYPSTWAYGVADRNGVFIARVPAASAGQRMSADFQRHLQAAPMGWYRGRTLEGSDTYTAYQTSAMTGWSTGVAIPSSEIEGAAWRAAGLLTAGALLSLLLAVVSAFWLGRRISAPIGRLAGAARQLGRREITTEVAQVKAMTTLAEVHDVASALEEAAAGLAEREALRQREQDALRAADKAKDEFLAMLGHELRNPLSAITASAHVLRLSKPGANAAVKAHEVIDRQARQMTRLVEDLMDVSRLAMGKVTLQLERLDLAALAERVLQAWQQAGRTRAGRVHLVADTAWVEADRARLEQVLANLLDNAHKFSAGNESIEVLVGADSGAAVLQVRDHGDGIRAEDLSRVFGLFVQGPQSFDRPHGGIGLGLALVRRLVELQHGSVTASSGGAGQGACFTVRLPLAPAPVGSAVSATPPSTGMPGRRVLLVEDNEDGRQAMELALALEGHTVRSVASGEEAVRVAAAWRPDIALVDIGLPDIDGYEVARRIRGLSVPDLPRLVAISGFGQPQDQRTAYEAGFDLHLTKPVAPEFLRDVLHALTSSRQAAAPT
jgi:signal transduction histidine kinase/CheY-like chemotaxis protein/type II secretory pathway pseudopilin PulG